MVATRPPEAYRLLLARRVDAAMVPLALAATSSRVEPLTGAPMVYSAGETMSTVIVSKKPVRLESCTRIALTGETRTSAAYLALLLEEKGLAPSLRQVPAYTAAKLLSYAPCALLLGDQALRARAQGYHVVADIGAEVARLYHTSPVYAVTAIPRGAARPTGLRGPPWPKPTGRDYYETARATGLTLEEAKRYHSVIKLGYDKAALLNALGLVRRGLRVLASLLVGEEKTLGRGGSWPGGEESYLSLISM